MNRTVKITAALFGILLLGITGTYGYFSDTLKVTNHLAVGDVNIGLAEYEKKGSTEVAYRNPKVLLPERFFQKFPGSPITPCPAGSERGLLLIAEALKWKGWMNP